MSESKAKTQKFIVKFFPEVMVKGSKAKRQMIDQLYSNIRTILERISKNIEYKKFFDKIEIVCPIDVVVEVRESLLNTSGIELVLEALQFDNVSTIDEMKEIVNKCTAKEIQGKSFVVRAKRTGQQEFKSTDMERNIGGYMLAQNPNSKGVDLRNAEVTINIELIHKQLNIITQKYQGLSGFPIGTQGDILSLMSGGFDSTIASYLTMKRGIKTHFVFFNLGGIAHEIGVKQVAYYLWNKYGSSHRITFTSVPFEDVVTEIFNSTSQSYMGVTLKRLMLMASEKIADKMGIEALLTGESVAQVSSQTLRNLALIDQVTNKLVLRPLATMNKPEIMEMANKIGTRRFAETMPEYCGVISQNPITHGSFSRMEKEAEKFNYEVLDKAVENAITINVDDIDEDVNDIGQVDIVNDISSGEYTIIDIRQNDDCIETSCETIKIPFFKLKSQFEKLPQDKQYLFYCDKGILSQLHAQYLIDSKGYKNIKVYRPQ
ncbi:tRNA 4-thiouridine(8) synthase ThiI [Arcobacter sp. CECT 8983]|uniref:tRNA uracil 4-sulfurtransferase ThiI n=1 Tax=Arcobacter sp. CECT 8983 TaxID=2044508 RepID=UPI00100ACB9A|nr:tRNA uracil 4-sulfurtransferase ThiI [Arcobacter sp. CECT 8983]RXJ90849.1 tRNA 4-thiouridine(8) synthase ThiI [Arcobacter sp. CECT 8983]